MLFEGTINKALQVLEKQLLVFVQGFIYYI
jgi:hypothetical protein